MIRATAQAASAAPSGTDGWVRAFHPAPDAPVRLVCLPHAGGSASFFFPVSRALSPEFDVVAIQYPGRQDRRGEPCVADMRTLADRVTEALDGLLDRPLVLFGHSMGALLGYEVALRLEAAGRPPSMLFASGRRAPSRSRAERVHTLSDELVVAELRRLDGTDTAVLDEPDMRAAVLPAVRADYRAVETYRHTDGDRLRCPVRVLVGAADPHVTADEAQDWALHTSGGCTVTTYPGGHFYLLAQAAAVIGEIRAHSAAGVGTTPSSPVIGSGPRRM